MVLVPDEISVDSFRAARVDRISEAVSDADMSADAKRLPLALADGESQGTLTLMWPATTPHGIGKPEIRQTSESELPPETASDPPGDAAAKLERLPPYTRSLLRIKVPLTVTLARKKQPIDQIVEMCPGSIISFDKSCDEMLNLSIGNCDIASANAPTPGSTIRSARASTSGSSVTIAS